MTALLFAPALISLLVPPPEAAPSATDLSLALPGDLSMILLADDLQAALHGDERGNWARFLTDESWREGLADLFADDTFGDPWEIVDHVLAFAGRVDALALGVTGDPADLESGVEEPSVVLIAFADDAVLTDLRALVEEADGEAGPEPEELETAGGVATGYFDDDFAIVQRGSVVAAHFGWGAEESVSQLFAALDEPGEEAPWWITHEQRRAGAQVELFVDLAEVELPPNPFVAALGVTYASMGLGSGNEMEVFWDVRLGAEDSLGPLADACMEPNVDLLRLAEDDGQFSVMGLDVEAALEHVIDLIDLVEPGVRDSYEAGLEFASEALGLDPIEDLIGNLTGQLITLERVASAEALENEDLQALVEESFPVFAFELRDAEPFVQLLESLLEMVEGTGAPIALTDEGDATVLRADSAMFDAPGLGEFALAVDGTFFVAGTAAVVDEFLDLAADREREGPFDAEVRAAIASELEGVSFRASNIPASIDKVSELIQSLASSPDFAEDPEMQLLIEFFDIFGESASHHLEGTSVTEFGLSSGGLSLRLFTL